MFFFNSKKTILKSGFLEGFIDRHSHLLPGVDDGFQSTADTLQALSFMENAGVSEIWLTPHIMEDIANKTEELRNGFEKLKNAYNGKITLHLAAENMLDNLFQERFEAGDLLKMENETLLIETSYFNPPIDFWETIEKIKSKGYRPLLAHPERYKYMDFDDYKRLKDMGVMFQLNLGALAKGYSEATQKKAEELLKRGYYDRIGSDVHRLQHYRQIIDTPISNAIISRLLELKNSSNS